MKNEKGSLLIIAYLVFYVLIAFVAGFALTNIGSLNHARRFRDASAAFWAAEAGVARFLTHPSLLDHAGHLTIPFGDGTIQLKKDDRNPQQRVIISTGTVRGVSRSIQIVYATNPPDVYENALSVGGNVSIAGNRVALNIQDRLRASGKIVDTSRSSSVVIEDKKEGFNPYLVTLQIPDADRNGKGGEFSDFVAFYRNLITNYTPQEVVYLKGDGTFILTPTQRLQDKKIIFIDGTEGRGDVQILMGGTLQDEQNLTIVSTGTVTFHQAGAINPRAQLNIVSWAGYNESVMLAARHRGIIFTNGPARFSNINDTSVTQGCVIANGGMIFDEVWARKTFRYADVLQDGALPPGFEGLIGGRDEDYILDGHSWKEI